MLEKLTVLFCVVHCSIGGITSRKTNNSVHRELFELPIVHINDFHARFVQTSPTSGTCHQGEEDKCIGGLGRLMTVTYRLMKEKENSIFLNAGDVFQGTLWYNLFKWNVSAHFMNKLPHDAMTIGNHEFDDRIEGLVQFLQHLRAPVVSANIDASEEPTIQGLYKNSTIITRGNQSIGVIGVLIKTANTFAAIGKLKLLDEVEAINLEAERLKAREVNIIIVLSHAGLDVDRTIAAKCPEVDVIVGGHSHLLLYSGKPPFTDKPADVYPVVVKQNISNRTVLIVHAGSYNKYVGNLTVWFDQQGEVADWAGNPIFLDNSIEQDPEMMKELQPWAKAVDVVSNKVVGETREPIGDSKGCNAANLISDAMVHYYKNRTDNPEHWTYAAISCINEGGIRSGISLGNVTYGDLITVQPFAHIWNVVELKGDDIRLALEECVSLRSQKSDSPSNGMLYWSGLKVTYNMSMPAWSRVVDVAVRCQACKEPTFQPLSRDEWYRVVVSDFVLNEGDGLMTIARKHRNFQLGPVDIDAFVQYFEETSPVSCEIDKRMKYVGE